MELRDEWTELETRGLQAVVFSQEDEDLESFARMSGTVGPDRPYPLLADLEREATAAYDRTTVYYVDEAGIVRQVFPMIIHGRVPWSVILDEVDRLRAAADLK